MKRKKLLYKSFMKHNACLKAEKAFQTGIVFHNQPGVFQIGICRSTAAHTASTGILPK